MQRVAGREAATLEFEDGDARAFQQRRLAARRWHLSVVGVAELLVFGETWRALRGKAILGSGVRDPFSIMARSFFRRLGQVFRRGGEVRS